MTLGKPAFHLFFQEESTINITKINHYTISFIQFTKLIITNPIIQQPVAYIIILQTQALTNTIFRNHLVIQESLRSFTGTYGLSLGGLAFGLQSRLRSQQNDETTNHEDEEERKTGDVQIALRSEKSVRE